MNMSKAALPPIQPRISDKDRLHPLFNLYQQYRSSCSMNLIEANSFDNWLYQYNQNQVRDNAANDSQYPDFMKWMVQNQGGARKCPAGNFPNNFYYWIKGGRW